jgi:hypothetical protein
MDTEVCIAFKQNVDRPFNTLKQYMEDGWRSFHYFVADMKYIHSEIIIRERCSNNRFCSMCATLLDEGRRSKTGGGSSNESDKVPRNPYHCLSYTTTLQSPVGYRVDREFDYSYDFLTFTLPIESYTRLKSFLNAQRLKPYLAPSKIRMGLRPWLSPQRLIMRMAWRPNRRSRRYSCLLPAPITATEATMRGAWNCSELIGAALLQAGYDIQPDCPDFLYFDVLALAEARMLTVREEYLRYMIVKQKAATVEPLSSVYIHMATEPTSSAHRQTAAVFVSTSTPSPPPQSQPQPQPLKAHTTLTLPPTPTSLSPMPRPTPTPPVTYTSRPLKTFQFGNGKPQQSRNRIQRSG